MEKLLKASLDWLGEIAYPQAEFHHPNDENAVKCASRALNKFGVPININEVKAYCSDLGWPQKAIEKVVDWYSRPKRLRLKSGWEWETRDLKEIWERLLTVN